MSFSHLKSFGILTFALSISTLSIYQFSLADVQNDCFKSANLAFGSNDTFAAEVCQDAETLFPALCFRNATNMKGIPPKVAAELCKNAINMAPSDCFKTATVVNGMTEEGAVNLCKTRPTEKP